MTQKAEGVGILDLLLFEMFPFPNVFNVFNSRHRLSHEELAIKVCKCNTDMLVDHRLGIRLHNELAIDLCDGRGQ